MGIFVKRGVSLVFEPSMIGVLGECGVVVEEFVLFKKNVTKKISKFFLYFIKNALFGVWRGFSKQLLFSGVGYKVYLLHDYLCLVLGYSHVVKCKIPSGVRVFCDQKCTEFVVFSVNKELLGRFVWFLKNIRRYNFYKNKGIREAKTLFRIKIVRKKL